MKRPIIAFTLIFVLVAMVFGAYYVGHQNGMRDSRGAMIVLEYTDIKRQIGIFKRVGRWQWDSAIRDIKDAIRTKINHLKNLQEKSNDTGLSESLSSLREDAKIGQMYSVLPSVGSREKLQEKFQDLQKRVGRSVCAWGK